VPVDDLDELVDPSCLELAHDPGGDRDIGNGMLPLGIDPRGDPHGKGKILDSHINEKASFFHGVPP